MEHFYQLDPRIGTGATGLCGPTSSAMVINHFAKRHPNLKPGNTSAYDLIRAFAEAEGAGRTTGVTKGALEDKLERCIRKAGYDATIETHGVAFGTDVSFRRYDLAQVARRLQDEDTAIVVIIGGYDYDPRRNDYIRDYGHVMVLAGYDPEGLTLADPARRSGPSRYRLREVPHQDASLMDASKAYAIRRTTQGLHELVRGEEYHDIIETLIVIHVSDPKRP
ncbi:MAG TPA: C39 family peptidase, partial [Holophaga sp.]|nr:C39 family peptidase [Holophaga sp.]